MVKSMTGYGRAEETVNGCTITVELRSVNNRYLDCNVRIPRLYLFAEESIKSRVQNTISRGKVDVFVTLDGAGAEEVRVSVNRPLAQQYANALQELAQLCGPTAYRITPETLSRFPEVLMAEKAEENVEEKAQDICRVLDLALADFDQMRSREGQRLEEDILSRARTIEELVGRVEERCPPDRIRVPGQAGGADERGAGQYPAGPRPDPHGGGHLCRQGGGGRGDRPAPQPHRTASDDAGQGRRCGSEAGLPDPGVQPGGQHHRLQVQRHRDCPPCGGHQGRDREDPGTDPEYGVRGSPREADQHRVWKYGLGRAAHCHRKPGFRPIKRMVQEARDRGVLIDATYGRRTRAVLIMDNDHLVLSALQTETVANRLAGEREADDGEEELE